MQTFADKVTMIGEVSFVMCEECFWCASWMSPTRSISKCSMCFSNRVCLIPIAKNESYVYSVTESGGLDVRFSTRGKNLMQSNEQERTDNHRVLLGERHDN
jgi:hypothetical protein